MANLSVARTWLPLSCLLLLLAGSPLSSPARSQKQQLEKQISGLMAQGSEQIRSGQYAKAIGIYRQGLEPASRSSDVRWMLKLQNNIGSGHFSLFEYEAAIQAYLKSRDLAKQHGLFEMAAVVDVNIASLYILLGDLEAANSTAEEALQLAGSTTMLGYRYQLLACLAELRAKQGRREEAIAYYRAAIAAADFSKDTNAMARIWDHLGGLLMVAGQFDAGEGPLFEAFRLRRLAVAGHGGADRDLRLSYVHLAWFRIEQGDLNAAENLLTAAEAMPAMNAGEPPWMLTYLRARLSQKQGHSTAALKLYLEAFRNGLEWQKKVGPADHLRGMSYTREEFQRVYLAATEASLSVGPSTAIEAFEATEQYRAAALSDSLSSSRKWLTQEPAAYWALLDRLRVAQLADLEHHTPATAALISLLRKELAELQSKNSTGGGKSIEKNTTSGTLRSIQANLRPDEALLSFYPSTRSSTLWAVSDHSIQRLSLPGKAALETLALRFRSEIETRQGTGAGAELFRELFRGLNSEFEGKEIWIVSATAALADIPFAALVVEEREGKPVYLLEKHAIFHTPSANMLDPRGKPVNSRLFVGLGDGVYNVADVRWRPDTTVAAGFSGNHFALLPPAPKLQLPRLLGSGPEIDACARSWDDGAAAQVFKGQAASSETIKVALVAHPAILHIAAHVVAPSADHPEESAINLGLTPGGGVDVLTSDEIAALDAADATVVLSGCSSSAGPSVPGKGVLGLTRAWLLAGARVVVGSRWPTPDDTGELFQSFYRTLRNRQMEPDRTRAVASSLQHAQLEMLHSKSWRSDPWYWSAFFAVGKE